MQFLDLNCDLNCEFPSYEELMAGSCELLSHFLLPLRLPVLC